MTKDDYEEIRKIYADLEYYLDDHLGEWIESYEDGKGGADGNTRHRESGGCSSSAQQVYNPSEVRRII